jgi:hypothetical protein
MEIDIRIIRFSNVPFALQQAIQHSPVIRSLDFRHCSFYIYSENFIL